MNELCCKISSIWRTSIAKKVIVALTGVCLLLFVFVHMVGNLLVFVGPDALNAYGHFLQHFLHGWGVWIFRFGLLGIVFFHVLCTIQLTRQNRAARGVAYACDTTVQATKSSRVMVYTGLLLLAFIIYHLLHFTISPSPEDPGYWDEAYNAATGKERHDVYAMVIAGFSNVLVSGIYIVAVAMLCSHLSHGFSSAFQTLGLRREQSWPVVVKAGQAYALLILIGNISIPLAILTGLVK